MNKDIINATKHILMEIKRASENGLTEEKKESMIEELLYIRDLINSFDINVQEEYYYFLINLKKNNSIFSSEQITVIKFLIENIEELLGIEEVKNINKEEITLEDIIREQEEDYQEKVQYYQTLNAQKKEKKLRKRQN